MQCDCYFCKRLITWLSLGLRWLYMLKVWVLMYSECYFYKRLITSLSLGLWLKCFSVQQNAKSDAGKSVNNIWYSKPQELARIGCHSEGFDWSISMFGLQPRLTSPPFTQITRTEGSLICTQKTHSRNNQLSPFTWFLQLQARILLSHLSTHSPHFLATLISSIPKGFFTPPTRPKTVKLGHLL